MKAGNPDAQMVRQAKTLLGLRNRKDHLNSELSDVNEKIRKTEQELGNDMVLSQVRTFQLDTGQKFTVTRRLYPKIIEGAKKKFFTWLRRRRLGYVIREDINHNTLKKLAAERNAYLAEKHGETKKKKGGINEVTQEWDGMVDFHSKIGVSIRNRKGGQ